ncbi:hypothetical protein CDD80_5396 [Ophiocordyceps camponoti-rufipedis]|uniref:Uncharacterized protein n=1 Tax=Ophiocordyceps camponoti-rufipedis TaxID=2004952 RepID=A0A2C5YVC0_9HYPO|nr:hypothetical protein CDD80_5396 [Ophiocordyceps camponoti-rufipedis]
MSGRHIGPQAMWRDVVRAPVSVGRRLSIVVIAVLINHVRRVLTPWLGQFLCLHPVEAMKLARWSPHGHLEASLVEIRWPAVAWWLCRQGVEYELLRYLMTRSRLAADAHGVLLVVASLALVERCYAETCWAVALVSSTLRLLLFGDRPERDLVRRLVGAHPARAALLACLVLRWIRAVALPYATWLAASFRSLDLMLPVATWCVAAATAHLVRYSSRYFLAIEMSDMLITLGWMTVLSVLAASHELGRKRSHD